MAKKYKLSTVQKCPIHGRNITPALDKNTGVVLFTCEGNGLCSWVSNYEHGLRHKHNTTMAIQSIIDKIIASYPNSKKRKDILASTMRLAEYI